MNAAVWIFLGAFLCFATAWMGLVYAPHHQLKDIQVQEVEGTAMVNPRPYTGDELRGRQVYISLGCVYCHSQQVRGGRFNNDLQRGWGTRRSGPIDYIHDNPALLGTMRTGPDLINIGSRQPSREYHLLRLYDTRFVAPGSIMPPFRFLYERRPIVGEGHPDALRLEAFVFVELEDRSDETLERLAEVGFSRIDNHGRRGLIGQIPPDRRDALAAVEGVVEVRPYLEEGWEIVPTDDARALVAYLLSLDRTFPVEGIAELGD